MVSLVVAGWLIWLLPGSHLAAVVGIGPVDGVIKISSYYDATDVEGKQDGTYTPRAAASPRAGSRWTRRASPTSPGAPWRCGRREAAPKTCRVTRWVGGSP